LGVTKQFLLDVDRRRKLSCKGTGTGAIDADVEKDTAAGMFHGRLQAWNAINWRIQPNSLIKRILRDEERIGTGKRSVVVANP
jgi:hypothetical protein